MKISIKELLQDQKIQRKIAQLQNQDVASLDFAATINTLQEAPLSEEVLIARGFLDTQSQTFLGQPYLTRMDADEVLSLIPNRGSEAAAEPVVEAETTLEAEPESETTPQRLRPVLFTDKLDALINSYEEGKVRPQQIQTRLSQIAEELSQVQGDYEALTQELRPKVLRAEQLGERLRALTFESQELRAEQQAVGTEREALEARLLHIFGAEKEGSVE